MICSENKWEQIGTNRGIEQGTQIGTSWKKIRYKPTATSETVGTSVESSGIANLVVVLFV